MYECQNKILEHMLVHTHIHTIIIYHLKKRLCSSEGFCTHVPMTTSPPPPPPLPSPTSMQAYPSQHGLKGNREAQF